MGVHRLLSAENALAVWNRPSFIRPRPARKTDGRHRTIYSSPA